MRAARIDRNQLEIVEAVRKAGCSVQHLHTIGQGCPDLLIGIGAVNLLWEVKDGLLPPSRRLLTSFELDWHRNWRGQVDIVESVEDALDR